MDVVDKIKKGEPVRDPDRMIKRAGRRRRQVSIVMMQRRRPTFNRNRKDSHGQIPKTP